MAVQKLQISDFLDQSGGNLLLDVRSPSEYAHAHIPGAISFPLFTDEERKKVGTAYKQESREAAIRIGLDVFGPKMRGMVEQVESLLEKAPAGEKNNQDSRAVFVYCWRGGMRSGAVSWLLDMYGFRVFVLNGGYKSFRKLVLQSFDEDYPLSVIGGYTGSGKTEVLHNLNNYGALTIDLEAIASHKGSAFGKFGMPPQPTQEMFENMLAVELRTRKQQYSIISHNEAGIWIEDESQRIGDLNIPIAFWKRMRECPLYFLDVPFEERLDHILSEYGSCPSEKLIENIQRISKRLGPQHAKAATVHIEEGNTKEAFRILLHYYDKRYLKGLLNRDNLDALLTKVPCEKADVLNARKLTEIPTT